VREAGQVRVAGAGLDRSSRAVDATVFVGLERGSRRQATIDLGVLVGERLERSLGSDHEVAIAAITAPPVGGRSEDGASPQRAANARVKALRVSKPTEKAV
jgi:hypothetical protein